MSSKMDGFVNMLVDSMNNTNKGKTPYDTQAEVVRVENGTAYVKIPGGVKETPIKLTMDAKAGDSVQVRVSGGRAWLTGNATAPPTDDTTAIRADNRAISAQETADVAQETAETAIDDAARAKTAADDAQTSANQAATAASNAQTSANQAATAASDAQASADNANEYAARALGNLSTVQSVTETLNWITSHGTMTLTTDIALDPTHVYFVRDNNGDYEVGSYHYSVVTEPNVDDLSTYYELSIDESLNNYVGTHLAVTSEGLWLLPDSGGNKVLIATGSGSTYTTAGTYIIEKINNTDTVLASFTSSGAQIGLSNGAHSVIDVNGQRFYGSNGTKQLANIGYGSGTGEGGQIRTAPYYTFGTRDDEESAPGNYSFANGESVVATGYSSHAEGVGTGATRTAAHAEGLYNVSWADGAHSEGRSTQATGNYSHSEGDACRAIGDNSHAQNLGTRAESDNQTTLGKYNVVDNQDTYAVIIGNGTASDARSNAFTIDWSGNVDIPTGSTYKVNGTSLIDLIYPVGSIYMSVNNTDPGLLFGGTWQQIQDSFLLAAGTTYSAGATGGTASHTLIESNLPKITGTVKLASNIARNTDTANTLLESASGKFTRVESTNQNVVKLNSSTSTVSTGKTLYTSAKYEFGQTTPDSLDNLPPYLAVYVWKRTA